MISSLLSRGPQLAGSKAPQPIYRLIYLGAYQDLIQC
jgi:hypothetical protein